MFRETVLLFSVSLWAAANAATLPCVNNGKCGCDVKDPSANNATVKTVDLNRVTSQDGTKPYFDAPGAGGYDYMINPCMPLDLGDPCNPKQEAMGCQVSKGNKYGIGRVDHLDWSMNNSVIQAHFQTNPSDKNARQTFLLIHCHEPGTGPDKPTLKFLTEGPGGHYWLDMELPDEYCQPVQPSKKTGTSSSGLSVGSVILICLLVVIVLYLSIGMVFKKVRMGATGMEIIPNRDFWGGLPGLLKDGTCLIFGCCGTRDNYEKI